MATFPREVGRFPPAPAIRGADPAIPDAAGRGPNFGPRIVPTSIAGAPAGPGMTLDALMARQKELAGQRIPMTEMRSPMQGIAYALEKGLAGWQQGQTDRDISTGQQAVGDAFASMGPNGELTPEGKAAIARYDPDQFLKLWAIQQQKAKVEQWEPIPTPEGENGQWFRNQNGETKKVGGGSTTEGAWKPGDLGSLRDDYSKAAATYDSAAPTWQTMKQAASLSLSPETDAKGKGTADYNMIVGFAKLLDPNSVVREGEVKSASMTEGMLNQVQSMLNQWTSKGMLDDGTRRAIMTQADSRMRSYYDQVKQRHSWISEIATRHKQDPRDVVPPLAEYQGWQQEEAPPKPFDQMNDEELRAWIAAHPGSAGGT